MRQTRLLLPYALLAFALGFSWFILAPLVPALLAQLKVALGSVLLLISLYGYAMIVGALPAGFWVAKRGPAPALRLAIILSVVGLLIRAISGSYTFFLVGQIIAALAYPFLIAPIGSILRLSGVKRTRGATGVVIGTLFLGMSMGSLLGSHLSETTDLWLAVVLNLCVGIWLWAALARLVQPGASRVGRVRLVVTGWWIVGFVISSVSVMYGSISTSALAHLHVANAVALGGFLSALTFLGSAAGAILFGWWGQSRSESRGLQRTLGLLTLVFLMASGFLLTGMLSPSATGLDLVFFVFGALSNGWYALALESSASAAQSAGSAGLATAGYSMASNVGVAILPVILGPLAISAPHAWLIILALMAIIAVLVPFVIKALPEPASDQGAT